MNEAALRYLKYDVAPVFRVSSAHAMRAVLLASAMSALLNPRRATIPFSQSERRSPRFASRLMTARAPWIICRRR